MQKKIVLTIAALLVISLLASCQSAQPTAAPTSAPAGNGGGQEAATLTVKGKVASEVTLSRDDLSGYGTITVTADHPKQGKKDYTGVPIQTILDKVGAQDDATELVCTAIDGYSANVPLADLEGCDACIVALHDGGKLSTVFSGLPTNTWVKDLVSIEVQ